MFRTFLALIVLAASPADAQIQSRPTDPPLVTAENDSWYRLGEPIQFAGDLYYPAGAAVFFNGNTMVRTGHYNGVPLYADTTVEPFSIVLVPISRGLMQPYERLRRGDLAGTTGSRTPSFPVSTRRPAGSLAAAAGPPTAPPLPAGAISVFTPETRPLTVTPPQRIDAGTTGLAGRLEPTPLGTAGRLPRTIVRPPASIVSLRRPENNDGVWIRFAGEKWISAGRAIPLQGPQFMQVGTYVGRPVYARRPLDEEVIYVPTDTGLIAPYRLKR